MTFSFNELKQYSATAWYMYRLRCDREVRGRSGSDEGLKAGLWSCRAAQWFIPIAWTLSRSLWSCIALHLEVARWLYRKLTAFSMLGVFVEMGYMI